VGSSFGKKKKGFVFTKTVAHTRFNKRRTGGGRHEERGTGLIHGSESSTSSAPVQTSLHSTLSTVANIVSRIQVQASVSNYFLGLPLTKPQFLSKLNYWVKLENEAAQFLDGTVSYGRNTDTNTDTDAGTHVTHTTHTIPYTSHTHTHTHTHTSWLDARCHDLREEEQRQKKTVFVFTWQVSSLINTHQGTVDIWSIIECVSIRSVYLYICMCICIHFLSSIFFWSCLNQNY
jgi:hypothetical protein